ncbi:MAG TPA: ribonuclease III domain-containing protein [Soehngenia sp.]|nr:ribonuclease III domain-containing protein [Soehngenia sp.]HPP32218.1 ribonuclease III domain-containing protein [Soehngenia sp.]
MEKNLINFLNISRELNLNLSLEDVKRLHPLQLAYIGDAVYELMVRTAILEVDLNVNKLNEKARKYVKATSQASAVKSLEGFFNEKELSIIRRGRNAKINSSPKNTELIDYKYATGLECLFGYLYLTNQFERIKEIFLKIYDLGEGALK